MFLFCADLITTILRGSVYGVNVNTNVERGGGGGLLIGRTKKSVVVAVYSSKGHAEAIQAIESFERLMTTLSA